MNWMMSNPVAILEILLLSSLTGTVVLAVWYLASCFFVQKDIFTFLSIAVFDADMFSFSIFNTCIAAAVF